MGKGPWLFWGVVVLIVFLMATCFVAVAPDVFGPNENSASYHRR